MFVQLQEETMQLESSRLTATLNFMFRVLVVGVVSGLLAACGGGNSEDESWHTDPKVLQAMKLAEKALVSWDPSFIAFNVNPGARQNIPVVLTTKVALKNAKIVLVPSLRNAVTVSPEIIPVLGPGESTTVIFTFAPSASDMRKVISGAVLLREKEMAVSKPLIVKISVVKIETINAIPVPPEPIAVLNNATLEGFDTNGNGVRDDVERLIAREFGTNPAYLAEALVFARAELAAMLSPTEENVARYGRAIDCDRTMTADQLDKVTFAQLNTRARGYAYANANAGTSKEACQ
jgi:hypothetical protein